MSFGMLNWRLLGLVPDDGLHLDQVDHALVGVFRRRSGNWIGTGLAQAVRICSTTLKKLAPVRSILLTNASAAPCTCRPGARRFRTAARTPPTASSTMTGAVEHAHRALDFDGEIDVTRGVDDVDTVLRECLSIPFQKQVVAPTVIVIPRSLLLLHPVHGRGAVVNLTDLVVDTGVEKGCARSWWSCRRRCAR